MKKKVLILFLINLLSIFIITYLRIQKASIFHISILDFILLYSIIWILELRYFLFFERVLKNINKFNTRIKVTYLIFAVNATVFLSNVLLFCNSMFELTRISFIYHCYYLINLGLILLIILYYFRTRTRSIKQVAIFLILSTIFMVHLQLIDVLSIVGILLLSKIKIKRVFFDYSWIIIILSSIYFICYEVGLSVMGVILLTINVLIQFIERRLKNEITI